MYNVTKDGTVTNKKTGKELKPFRSNGRWAVRAWGTNSFLHRLVWEFHNGKISDSYYIDFKDGDVDNYHLDNLIIKPKFCLQDDIRLNESYPYVVTRETATGKKFFFKIGSKTISKADTSGPYKTVEQFYNKVVLPYVGKKFGSQSYPMYGHEDEFDIIIKYGGDNVIYNRVIDRYYHYSSVDGMMRINDSEGRRIRLHLPTVAWNSMYPHDLAERAEFRTDFSEALFDLIKVD